MPELDRLAITLGAECDADDTLLDVLSPLRAQHPVPLVVTRDDVIEGTVGLEVVVDAFGRDLASIRVGEVMRPAPQMDAGEAAEHGVAAMRAAGSAAVIVTESAGGLFSRQRDQLPVGMVTDALVLATIGKNVTDKAPMKILAGHRDLGLNVPVSPCQRNCPIKQDIATYVDYVSQGRYVNSWTVIHETNPFPSMLGGCATTRVRPTASAAGTRVRSRSRSARSSASARTSRSRRTSGSTTRSPRPTGGASPSWAPVLPASPARSTCAFRATTWCCTSASRRWAAC